MCATGILAEVRAEHAQEWAYPLARDGTILHQVGLLALAEVLRVQHGLQTVHEA